MTDTGPTYFTVSNEPYFLGAVAMINSLRLTGNRGEIVLLDMGLTAAQRNRLEPHVRIFDAPAEVKRLPMLVKPFPYLLEPQGRVVIIDSDMIVTRPFDPILEQAASGKVCAFEDGMDRWIAEWESALGLAKPLRRQDYVNSGFVAFSTEHQPDLLRRWWEACHEISNDQTMWGGRDGDDPFFFADQDALNALLMSEVEADALAFSPGPEAPAPSVGGGTDWLSLVKIEDKTTLRCSIDGTSPYLLHYLGIPKPWQRQSWMRVERDAFVELMPRVLCGDDVAIRMDRGELPPWCRPGALAGAARSALGTVNHGSRRILARVPPDFRRRLAVAVRRMGK